MAGSFIGFSTHYEITPGSYAQWVTVDLSSYLPSVATGVVLFVRNTHAGAYVDAGIRKYGSTDDRHAYGISNLSGSFVVVGVSTDKKVDIWAGTSSFDVFLMGYTTDGVTFNTNHTDITPSGTSGWQDYQLPEGAIGAIVEQYHSNGLLSVGARMKGSTDDRTNTCYLRNCWSMIVGCDDDRYIQLHRSQPGVSYYLAGYITSGCTFFTNAEDVSLSQLSQWTDLDMPAHAYSMPFIEVVSAGWDAARLRPEGGSEVTGNRVYYHQWLIPQAGDAYGVEGHITQSGTDFFLTGFSGTALSAYSPQARVSGIRHIYRPGSYRAEVMFGDLSIHADVVRSKVILPPAPEEEKPELTEPERTVVVPEKTVPEIIEAIEADTPAPPEKPSIPVVSEHVTAEQAPPPKIESLELPSATTGFEVPTVSEAFTLKKEIKPSDFLTYQKRKKAFEKYGYTESWVRQKIKEGWQPGDIVRYMMEHPLI